MSSTIADTTNEIFCLYASKDRRYVEELCSHLSHLQHEGIVSSWYDRLIEAGQHRHREIETHLNTANIILLFVSADFFADDLCMNTLLPDALQRSNRKDALVIPVLIRECDWKTAQFADLQALPREGKPIAAWRSRDDAYTGIVRSIRGFISNQQVPPMRCLLLNLPFHRNRLFTGREEILQKLHSALESKKETALMQAVKGLGGIGKTQTVIEYAYRYQDSYARIIWLNGESRETITSDVERLAREINTPGCYDKDQNIIVQGFLTWLERQRNWLLILDNVEDIALVRSYMPKGNQGHLLLTTRRQSVGGVIESISLDPMDEETGATFLLKRAELSPERIGDKEIQFARRISKELGGLPLALDQAGGYIERKQCGFERYLQIYEQARERLLAESGFPDDTTDYKYTVATTWSLSFQQVAQRKYGQAATDLLRLCAFLASDNIPLPIFEKVPVSMAIELLGPNLSQVSANPVELEDVLETLLKYSLIRREDRIVLFIHRLVQTVLRDAMTEEEHSLWAERAIKLMAVAFPDPKMVEAWSMCLYTLPHMLACIGWVEHARIRTKQSALLLNQTAVYLEDQGVYKGAELLYEEALAITREVWGDEHSETAKSLNNLASLYDSQGQYEKAEPLYEEALAIWRKVLGEEHPLTATSLSNLAQLYESQGRDEEAVPLCKQALAIKQKVLGEEHPDTAISLSNLASLYGSQGKYADAEPLCKRALEIFERQLGAKHPQTAKSLNNLATLYNLQGRAEEAEPLYKRALSICEEQLGAEHPDTAMCLNTLANLYRSQGSYEKAEPLYERALSIHEQQLGAEHPNTAMSLNDLAFLYKSQGKYAEAEPLYERALEICKKQLGEEHPNTAASLSNLGLLYYSQGRHEEAVLLCKQVLAIRQKVLGEQHPDTAMSLNNLASLYVSLGKYADAEPLFKEALTNLISVLGEEHPNTQIAFSNYLAFREKAKKKKVGSTPLQWIKSLLKTD